jgi:hypothetical protein
MQNEYFEKCVFSQHEKNDWFGEGEWVKEPDIVIFTYNGYQCFVRRVFIREPCEELHFFGGYLCGYVSMPKDHVLYGKEYEEMGIECHFGLTFSEFKEEEYWIGFDCAHSGDYIPSYENLKKQNKFSLEIFSIPEEFMEYSIFNPVYRNIEYCICECKSIVDQLIGINQK